MLIYCDFKSYNIIPHKLLFLASFKISKLVNKQKYTHRH